MNDIAALRRNYAAHSLDVSDVDADPLRQFLHWFAEARQVEAGEPNVMTLATVSPEGAPTARVVLLKNVDDRGLVFYTNFESAKGRELAANPRAALVFFWGALERQVRVEGAVERVSDDEADAYFASRPIESRLGAWASPQSEVVPSREGLDARYAEALARFGDAPPRPPHWGGCRVVPTRVEFWQGRPGRMHDRVRYRRDGDAWVIERLAP
jgi:pyridoxamine 5'-phosphate oxidase